MSLTKKTKDKKVNFEFNKEYIRVVTSKIANNDAQFITNSFNDMHPADAADIIEHLSKGDRESLIKLNNFNIDPDVFVELNESIKSEIITYLSFDSIVIAWAGHTASQSLHAMHLSSPLGYLLRACSPLDLVPKDPFSKG